MIRKVLTVAGSDSGGGAGIQADIKTITMHKMYAMSVICALTAQNTMGVYGVEQVSADFVKRQMECVFSDIFPDAVKIGMVKSGEIANVICDSLKKYSAKNIVVDPVMVATSGGSLIDEGAQIERLFEIARLVTPNIYEAQFICNMEIKNVSDMERAALAIYEKYGCSTLVKGGHLTQSACDVLCEDGRIFMLEAKRVDCKNTHGTGCTLSSAIACNLAEGKSLFESVKYAKEYVYGALLQDFDLGCGNGPLMHNYILD